MVSKVRNCFGGKRRNLPYNFAAVYPGEGKEKVGARAMLSRGPHKRLLLQITWFETEEGPPGEFGHMSELLGCIPASFAE